MHDVTIRSRTDGIVELGPRLAPLPPLDRAMVVTTVFIVTGAFFVVGVMPPLVALAILLTGIAGELVLGLKAAVLLLLRRPAEVREVPRWSRRHR